MNSQGTSAFFSLYVGRSLVQVKRKEAPVCRNLCNEAYYERACCPKYIFPALPVSERTFYKSFCGPFIYYYYLDK